MQARRTEATATLLARARGGYPSETTARRRCVTEAGRCGDTQNQAGRARDQKRHV